MEKIERHHKNGKVPKKSATNKKRIICRQSNTSRAQKSVTQGLAKKIKENHNNQPYKNKK